METAGILDARSHRGIDGQGGSNACGLPKNMKQIQPVWFVIVTYKPDPAMLTTLRKILEGKPVIEIDNTQHNVGYGGGANAGIRKALARGAEWVVILNQDIEISKKGVEELCLQLASLPSCIAGPWAGALDEKRWTTILPSRYVDYISGSCIAINRSVFEKIGYFYAPYFMYYEDVDLCVRAARYGFPLKKLNVAGIEHTDRPVWEKGSRIHEYYLARNHLLFVWRLAPWRIKLYELLRLP